MSFETISKMRKYYYKLKTKYFAIFIVNDQIRAINNSFSNKCFGFIGFCIFVSHDKQTETEKKDFMFKLLQWKTLLFLLAFKQKYLCNALHSYLIAD